MTKPIALVGQSYGSYDKQSMTRNILDHEDWHFEDRGSFLAPSEFENYSMVVIAYEQERPFTTEEQNQVREYLEKGGKILLLSQIPRKLADDLSGSALREWLGFDVGKIKPLDPDVAILSTDPVMEGVILANGTPPSWIVGDHGATNLEPDVEVLIGDESTALALRRPVGKGMLIYLGSELFRLRLPSSPHVADSDSYVRLIRNILATADPLRLLDWREAQADAWRSQEKRFLVWNREWQRGIAEGPIFVPPLPVESELIDRLSVDLAVNEYEALQVNLTDLGPGGVLTWKVDGLPDQALAIYAQDEPPPIPWPKNPGIVQESPFWLMPPKALDPKGEEAVGIAPGSTRILWLKFHSSDIAPGSYPASITFSIDGEPMGRLALDVKVHPVKIPERKLITVQPFGHVYGDVNDTAPALRFKRNLQDLGFEWSLINVLRPQTFLVNGEPLTPTTLRKDLDAILSKNPPFLDFASMDEFLDAALDHNLTYFRITQSVTESIDAVSAKAQLNDAQIKAVRQWYLKELGRYLRDKGIRHVYASMGDEMSEAQLRERFIPWTQDLAEAGWSSTSSFTTPSVANPELTRALSKFTGAWTLNRIHIPQFMEWVKDGTIELPDNVLVGTYGAGEGRGTEIRKNASASRMIGWEAWALGTDYCAPNPYFKSWLYYTEYRLDRGVAGERFVSFLDQDNLEAPLVNSPFIEGIRESMEEANLAAIMNWYLEKLGDRVPAELKEQASGIVGSSDAALIEWKPRNDKSVKSQTIDAEREDYLSAKRAVLEILGELRTLARETGIQPDIFWHNLPLIRNGEPVATLVTAYDTPELTATIAKWTQTSLPISQEDPGTGETVVFIGGPDDPTIPDWVKEQRGKTPETYSWIRDWKDPKSGRNVLWIGGTDEKQIQKALSQFNAFLRQEGVWLLL